MSDRYSYKTYDVDGNVIDEGKFYVALTEYGVFNFPPGMKGCRCFRIEYGGINEGQVAEGTIWLPPDVDVDEVENYFRDMFRDWEE